MPASTPPEPTQAKKKNVKKLFLPLFLLCAATVLAARPNILFIIADDQSPFDFKFYNPDSTLDSPVIDSLAKGGMVVDGAYHMGSYSGAVCNPSRHMVMTGRTLWNVHKIRSEGFDAAANSMAGIFNKAGYDTMRTCKKGNSYPAANATFSVVKDATKRGGTAESGSAWHAEQVLSYLSEREASKDEDPFLIYYGFSHPHDVRDGTPELLAKYGATNHTDPNSLPAANPKQPPLPSNYLNGHPFPDGHPGLRDEVKVRGVWEKRDERTIRNEIGRQFACSENIDIQIGRVLKKLEDMGELDNTYIFYTADHGMAIGRHGLQGKQNLYEHTWRVPFVVKGPGIKTGRAQGNIYLLDVLGTLCDFAGITPPETVESRSFRSVLEGKQQTVRDVLFGAYCGGTKPGMRSVRKGDWKLIKYDVIDGSVRETQLFNLRNNPHEYIAQHGKGALTDLAEDPKHASILAEMEALLLGEMRRLKDPYRLWNQPQSEVAPPAPPKRNKKPKKTKKK
jgi:choline-sulfatase